jgi:hypothetical protein
MNREYLSVTPGFSPVGDGRALLNRLNGFQAVAAKPLKRFWLAVAELSPGWSPVLMGTRTRFGRNLL